MRSVDHAQVEQLHAAGAQLVEVLDRAEFDWAHVPAAVHLPLRRLDERARPTLDDRRPIVVYCNDFRDMSPRAAWRLEQFDFDDVNDYAGGRMDWLARGGAYEGTADLVGGYLQPAPTCSPDDRVADIAAGHDGALRRAVTVADGVLVGVLDLVHGARNRDERAGDIAVFGTATVRPSEERAELDRRMEAAKVAWVPVTDPAGRLLGGYERGRATRPA